MLICIDPGHGGKDKGANGNNFVEKDFNLCISLKQKKIFENLGYDVIMTRTTDCYVSTNKRKDIVNRNKVDIFISNHMNYGGWQGMRVVYAMSSNKGKKLADSIATYLTGVGLVNNGIKGVEFNKGYYYFIKRPNVVSIFNEFGYVDNEYDIRFLKNNYLCDQLAKAIVKGVIKFLNIKTSIMGKSKVNELQMEQFLHKINPDAPYIAKIYLKEGKREGVRGDIAFAQAIKETNYFTFTGILDRDQNNFGGLGTTNKSKGSYFINEKIGIRAHIQHLKAYGCKNKLKNKLIDPRFYLVNRGSILYFERLQKNLNKEYGRQIIAIWNKILKTEVNKKDKFNVFKLLLKLFKRYG